MQHSIPIRLAQLKCLIEVMGFELRALCFAWHLSHALCLTSSLNHNMEQKKQSYIADEVQMGKSTLGKKKLDII
jgi:hypothetical protein